MPALSAFREGLRRVNGAPALLAGMVLATLLVAFPLSIALRDTIEAHLGESAEAGRAAEHANYDWWEEFRAQASGLGTTFTPSIIGFAAVLQNLGGLLDNQPVTSAVAGATVWWLVVWSFLTGGVLDRYARGRPTRAHGFFGACGTHFWRFLRLGVIAWSAYVVLFGALHGWIVEGAYGRLTRDLTAERAAFAVRAGGYLAFSALLAGCALVFDFARIRMVVEDRRSAVAAIAASVRFIARNGGAVLGLFLLTALAFLTLVAVYATLSPGAPRAGLHAWLVLGLGQAYIIGRHYVKLLGYASKTALFQGALAHAAYVAAPTIVWPDSPAVESLTGADPTPVSRGRERTA